MGQTSDRTGLLPEHVQKTVADMQAQIQEQEQETLESKRLVNSLLQRYGQPPMYEDLEIKAAGPIRGRVYYGQHLQTVVKDVLQRRRAANLGPATVAEIYDAMLAGDYHFDAKDEENAKRGLRISLTKNSATFIKLPSGKYDLREWYPAIKERRTRPSNGTSGNEVQADKDEPESANAFDFAAKEAAEAE